MPGRNNRKSSVIMAYWPSRGGEFNTSEYSTLSVGVVQYLFKHTVTVESDHETPLQYLVHVFAYVHWKQKHPHSDWFGPSAIVCVDIYIHSLAVPPITSGV